MLFEFHNQYLNIFCDVYFIYPLFQAFLWGQTLLFFDIQTFSALIHDSPNY